MCLHWAVPLIPEATAAHRALAKVNPQKSWEGLVLLLASLFEC